MNDPKGWVCIDCGLTFVKRVDWFEHVCPEDQVDPEALEAFSKSLEEEGY